MTKLLCAYPPLFQSQISQFVDSESLIGGVEEREIVKPLEPWRDGITVDEQACEEKTGETVRDVDSELEVYTYLNSMISVPTKLAMLVLANAIESNRITLAVVKLNMTRTSMNFQNVATSGTSPTNPYIMAP